MTRALPDSSPRASAADRGAASLPAIIAVVALLIALAVIIGMVTRSLTASPAPTGAIGGSAPGGPSTPSTTKAHPLTDARAALDAARSYLSSGEHGKAAAILERLLDDRPDDRDARLALAQALLGLKRPAEAYTQQEAAIALTPAPATREKAMRTDPDLARLHFDAGTIANVAGRAGRAVEHYSMAQTFDPREAKYPLYLAMMQIKSKDHDAAMATLVRAVKLDPELGEAWGTMAELELAQNRLGLAMQHLAEARRLQPESVKWRVVEARILNRQHQPERAATILLSLDRESLRNKSILALLGESYGLLQRPADAAWAYEQAAKTIGQDPELYIQAAVWAERAGDNSTALRNARAAAALGDQSAVELAERLAAAQP